MVKAAEKKFEFDFYYFNLQNSAYGLYGLSFNKYNILTSSFIFKTCA